jgi:alkyl sulfatase BDS1-like metallo-beta-lactamase superfamily hydrolase
MGEPGDLTMTRLDRKDASPATQAALEAARTTLPPEDGEDFRLARRGFIATIPFFAVVHLERALGPGKLQSLLFDKSEG